MSNGTAINEKLRSVRIIGVGKDFPGEPLSNEELLDACNLTDDKWTKEKALQWTKERVGIEYRYVSRDRNDVPAQRPAPGYENSSLCANAIRKAIENAKIDKNEIDMIIVATATPDYPVPGNAPIVQEKLDIPHCAVMDVRSACCGSLTAMISAIQYLRTGYYKTIAVCGCDVGSIFGNLDKDSSTYERHDFVNAIMIGDGAGAAILRGFTEEEQPHGLEFIYYGMNSIGVGKQPGMWLPLGGSMNPGNLANVQKGLGHFKHDYKAVLEHGPILYTSALNDALQATGLSISDFALFVPHQANGRIPELATKFGIPIERMFHNFERVGNTANASVMLCLAEIAEQNKLAEGDYVIIASAESTKWLYATIVLKWTSMTGEKNFVTRKRDPFWKRWYISTAFYGIRLAVSFREYIASYFRRPIANH